PVFINIEAPQSSVNREDSCGRKCGPTLASPTALPCGMIVRGESARSADVVHAIDADHWGVLPELETMNDATALPAGSLRFWYCASWCVIAAFYVAAYIANGVAAGFAVRNAIAYLLPEALLGLLVLKMPSWRLGSRGMPQVLVWIVSSVAFLVLSLA